MKETLRENIETMRVDMIARIKQLQRHEGEYVIEQNFNSAMICKIKIETLKIVLERLDEALKS